MAGALAGCRTRAAHSVGERNTGARRSPLAEIGGPTDIEVIADVLTRTRCASVPRNPVQIEAGGGEQPSAGRVRLVEPGAFTMVSALGVDEQRTNVVIDFVARQGERTTLGGAYRVDARIVVAALDDALIVPTGTCSGTVTAGRYSLWSTRVLRAGAR